jgi:hypothetical protein
MTSLKRVEWVLRVAVCGTFVGHGVLAIQGHSPFLALMAAILSFSEETSRFLLVAIGILDVFLAVLVLFRPVRLALVWMIFWGALTAIARPWSGLYSVWALMERSANWGAPLALLFIRGLPSRGKSWLS